MIEIWENTSLTDLDGEVWNDVLSYDGIYQVSNLGRVKSMGRYVSNGRGGERWVKEKILKQNLPRKKGELNVKLSVENINKTWNVATLVANAFMRDRGQGEIVCQKNKIRTDCRLSNLEIMSRSESTKIGHQKGVMGNWDIGQMSRNNRVNYELANGRFENGKLVSLICRKCKKDKPITEFYNRKNSKYRDCKNCSNKNQGVKEIGKNRYRMELAKQGFRFCSMCKQKKNLHTEFGNSKRSFMGKDNACKECKKVLNAKHNKLRKERKLQEKRNS